MPMTSARASSAAVWLGVVYSGAVAWFLLSGADAPDVVVLSIVFLPWIIGPAALAAFGAAFSKSAGAAWAFFSVEVAVIASTASAWTYLIVIAPDAQNGVAMLLFPVVQYGAVLLSFALAGLLGWRPKP